MLVFIGRFQPLHIGHTGVIANALTLAKNVLVLVGSANQPRTSKNPWTFEERKQMLFNSYSIMINDSNSVLDSRLHVMPLRDQAYNDQKWVSSVQHSVEQCCEKLATLPSGRPKIIKIIGHNKDESSYYLKMFPQWGEVIEHEMNEVISATDLRQLMFEGKNDKFLSGVVPYPVFDMIKDFKNTKDFQVLAREYDMIKSYKKAWEAAPYPPTFVTTDAVVVQAGHVLLIQRDASPGENLYAMPGGFLNQHERIEDGMLRELREETKLKVPMPVLKGSIIHKATTVYDKPDRSLRGRTITHAFLIELPPGPLPNVKGGDDARKAEWIPINDIREDLIFEDHYAIIQDLLGKLKL